MSAHKRAYGLLAAIMLAAIAGHALQIALFSHSLPFADQWDSEGYVLFRPWIENNLTLQTLFSTHNEHRIVWKRLFDLLLFEINGRHWDNRVIALANTVFYAGAMVVLGKAALNAHVALARRLVIALCLLLPFATYAYENTLWGFQSPFYQLALTGLLSLHLCAAPRLEPRSALLAIVLSVSALFTVASGFFVGPVCAVLVATTHAETGVRVRWKYALCALLLGIGIAGYLIMPQLDYHAPLRAQSLPELVTATLVLLSWPVPHLPLVWLPFLFWLLFSAVYRESPSRADRFFAAVALWTGIQAAALAYGRGHALTTVPSRYTDVLVFGLVANAYFLGSLLRHPREALRPRLPLRIILIGATLVAIGYAGLEMARSAIVSHHKQALWRANHESTAALLAGAPLAEDNFALAYPSGTKLTGLFLAEPSMRRMLGIVGNTLPPDCAVPATANLSRIACTLTGARPELPALRRETLPLVPTYGLQCSVDLIAGLPASGAVDAATPVPLRFAGWAGPGATDLRGLPRRITLRLVSDDGAYAIDSRLRGPRPDVAAAFGNPRFAWSGFDILVSSRGLAPASYHIELIEEGQLCATGQFLQVR
ncbi:MAG TPA: hypothetical protein VLF18_14410 [Tahibacter sp.]|uniref:hypothetical protein n=1 Tax=Tahibacter sp. TaxID=2056211 RepID=UPI002BB5C0BA|nr:hypothetical protein [Tahibacter sp.]HSX61391.1 hypothetical protein [Tahibacter sp.]